MAIFNNPNIRIIISERKDGSMKKQKELQRKNLNILLEKHHISDPVITMNQVHGNTVQIYNGTDDYYLATDAVVSTEPGTYVGVVTADCLPVLLYDEGNNFVAAAHAGYKGIYNDIISELVSAFSSLNSNVKNIQAGIGPAIGVCCYSVDNEREQMFRKKFGDSSIIMRNATAYLDLKRLAQDQLLQNGIEKNNITDIEICTQCNKDRYFSYRGDSDETFGEFISIIGVHNG